VVFMKPDITDSRLDVHGLRHLQTDEVLNCCLSHSTQVHPCTWPSQSKSGMTSSVLGQLGICKHNNFEERGICKY